MKTVLDVLVAVLVLSGAVFCLSGAIGLLRFPDTLTRLQASAKAQSLGLVMILIGAAVAVDGPYAGLLLLIAAFQLVTAPVTGQILGRIAYRTGAVDRSLLTADELAEHKDRLRAASEPSLVNGDADQGDRTDDREQGEPADGAERTDGAGGGRAREPEEG